MFIVTLSFVEFVYVMPLVMVYCLVSLRIVGKKRYSMSEQDPISTMLTMIRNGQMAGKKQVTVTYSNVKFHILEVLKEEGYIRSIAQTDLGGGKKTLSVGIKYSEDNEPAIHTIDRVSSPGLRVYNKSSQLEKVQDGLGISVVSTSQGVMTGFEAVKRNLGGEVLCVVT